MFKAAEAFLNTNKDFHIINIKLSVLTSPQCAALLHRPIITCEYSTHPAVVSEASHEEAEQETKNYSARNAFTFVCQRSSTESFCLSETSRWIENLKNFILAVANMSVNNRPVWSHLNLNLLQRHYPLLSQLLRLCCQHSTLTSDLLEAGGWFTHCHTWRELFLHKKCLKWRIWDLCTCCTDGSDN